ncbi:glycosyltransferase [Cellulomonas phragmiteti]|uniref:Glycosyltransferase 2-like domain-containing protein n=1 Tax=Cellulomonas phragmiteti TaxID=478780 RepID=A0ABQ4DHG7_9CELL|nr:glycosyltransferase family 2 protein [Cellulomonas phragmiteti]GIG38798.1 hypothetical protein Cph01nite_05600 [Cellulomonas phragmiteti]
MKTVSIDEASSAGDESQYGTTTIGFAVVNYHTSPQVEALLNSLAGRWPTDSITVIVDNSCSKVEATRLEHLRNRFGSGQNRIEVVVSGRNGGYAAGNNIAIQRLLAMNADVVCVLNPDVRVVGGDLAALAQIADTETAVLYGAATDTASGRRVSGLAELRPWTCRTRILDRLNESRQGSLRFPLGYFMCASSSTWRRVGGLSEDYFLYYEEPDLAARGERLGLIVSSFEDVVVMHDQGAATASGERQRDRNRATLLHVSRGATIFAWKHRRRYLLTTLTARVALALSLLATGAFGAGFAVLRGVGAGIWWIVRRSS